MVEVTYIQVIGNVGKIVAKGRGIALQINVVDLVDSRSSTGKEYHIRIPIGVMYAFIP